MPAGTSGETPAPKSAQKTTWRLAEPHALRRGISFSAIAASAILLAFVWLVTPASWTSTRAFSVVLIAGFDGFALGLTWYLTSKRFGWVGLWLRTVPRDLAEVVPAVEQGLSGAGLSYAKTNCVPTRRFLKKAGPPLELSGGIRVWTAPILRAGQYRGQPPETLLAIEPEYGSPEEVQRVKEALSVSVDSPIRS